MEEKMDKPDAGLASLDHYKSRMPRWRYKMREALLPIVRTETPYVAFLQERMRSPALDTYFAMTANLGTHTCFMVVLPILFWCGYTSLGRAMAHMLAAGVFFSGFVKDFLCLPRPLSPPLTRITMSGSAALEYGFPSTHSTNAVSVALYGVLMLRTTEPDIPSNMNIALQSMAYFYASSIILGRLYCGMHGFFDVVLGGLLGAVIAVVQCVYGPAFDDWLYSSDLRNIVWVVLVVLVLVRVHPEPADDCPCFDDSVAFAGVVLGISVGNWHFAQTTYAVATPGPATVPFTLEQAGWLVAILRTIVGVLTIFAWRGVMKPLLLKTLPPVFRVIEVYGLTLPRRFFKPASEYTTIPAQSTDDNIIPSARRIPYLLSNFRRRRAISVGPQSEADAHEAIAYRKKQRRDSLTKDKMSPMVSPLNIGSQKDYFQLPRPPPQPPQQSTLNTHTRKRSLSLQELRAQMGSPLSPHIFVSPPSPEKDRPEGDQTQEYLEEKELFASIQKPRVRYDVEVVTKLIVYTGIAWLAVEGNPILFHHLWLTR